MTPRADDSSWFSSDLRVAITRALLAAPAPLTASEIAGPLRQDPSNVRREADRMAAAGLLAPASPARARTARGRPSTKAYRIPEALRAAAAEAIASGARVGVLERGQELVFATAGAPHVVDLLHVLAESEEAAQASWGALCGQEYVLAFDGTNPAARALRLVAALTAARVPARQATVARAAPALELVQDARLTAREALRTRMARDTRDPSQGATQTGAAG